MIGQHFSYRLVHVTYIPKSTTTSPNLLHFRKFRAIADVELRRDTTKLQQIRHSGKMHLGNDAEYQSIAEMLEYFLPLFAQRLCQIQALLLDG